MDESHFKECDYQVMGAAFDIHNALGNLFSERTYQQELAARLAIPCDLEQPVTVRHKAFSKTYFMDAVVAGGIIYELKSCQVITAAHKSQLLQYMLLFEATRGKVINFGGQSVKSKLVSSTLNHELRRQLTFHSGDWRDSSREARFFRQAFTDFLLDVGGFLTLPLYYEGITCLLGGHEQIVKSINVHGSSKVTGSQKCHLLTPATAFKITAWTSQSAIDFYRKQLMRFLGHTDLDQIQWVNLHHQDIVFETVADGTPQKN